jgi:hypothetical protein
MAAGLNQCSYLKLNFIVTAKFARILNHKVRKEKFILCFAIFAKPQHTLRLSML